MRPPLELSEFPRDMNERNNHYRVVNQSDIVHQPLRLVYNYRQWRTREAGCCSYFNEGDAVTPFP